MIANFTLTHGPEWQRYAHASGLALKSHMDSAHDGKYNSLCRACRELKKKGEKK